MPKQRRLGFVYALVTVGLVLGLIVLMVVAAVTTRGRYMMPNESRNAYTVHMFESGVYQEQYMCSTTNCVLFRTPGLHHFTVPQIVIGGVVYRDTDLPMRPYNVYASGLYCPGMMDFNSCFEVSTLEPNVSCPAGIEYMSFRAPILVDSCWILK